MEVDKINSFKLARPSDFNILSAVSDKNIKTKFYTTQEYGVGSTLEKDFIKKENNVLQEKIISTKTLNEIIENSPYKNKEVDVLNIDVEGHDFKVLVSLDFNIYNPKIIIIESHIKNIDLILKSEIYLFLTKKNYSLRSWNLYSLIFVNNTSLITIDFKD
jgi:FkbM family methyltransferase